MLIMSSTSFPPRGSKGHYGSRASSLDYLIQMFSMTGDIEMYMFHKFSVEGVKGYW